MDYEEYPSVAGLELGQYNTVRWNCSAEKRNSRWWAKISISLKFVSRCQKRCYSTKDWIIMIHITLEYQYASHLKPFMYSCNTVLSEPLLFHSTLNTIHGVSPHISSRCLSHPWCEPLILIVCDAMFRAIIDCCVAVGRLLEFSLRLWITQVQVRCHYYLSVYHIWKDDTDYISEIVC